MDRAVLMACLPWLALLAGGVAAGLLLVYLGRAQVRPERLLQVHRDQTGGVQSLSFVLTLPLFVLVILFIVQVSQLMIGTIVVHYAAFAAARSAAVWIPAECPPPEGANCISAYRLDPEAPEQHMPILDPEDPAYGPAPGGLTFIVEPGSYKYNQITAAAVLACMAASPSRDLGLDLPPAASGSAGVLEAVYRAMAPSAAANPRTSARLYNKLAYALHNTVVEIRFYHKNAEPPLLTYFLPPEEADFRFNELGWQDQLTVTVWHNYALLPGPGRFLAKVFPSPVGADRVAPRIKQIGGVHCFPLTASATLVIEGEKPVIRYQYGVY